MQKHIEPPANLPVVPSTPALETSPRPRAEPEEAEGFRDPQAGDTVRTVPDEGCSAEPLSSPASRSLQPSTSSMMHLHTRASRAPDELLNVHEVAARLAISRFAVYRLVAKRRLPFYRLPGGLRFAAMDVDRFLQAHRVENPSCEDYGNPQDQELLVD